MKVYQIISEAPPAQKASARLQAMQSNVQAKQQAAQAQQLQAQQQAVAQAKIQAKAAADSTARRATHAAKGLTDKPPTIVRDLGRYARQNKIRYSKNTARAEAIEKGILGRAGWGVGWLLKIIGVLEPARELWYTVSGLEDDYKNGLIYRGHPMTKEEFEAERDFAYGVFETQILLPLIVRALSNMKLVTTIVRWIKNSAALVAAPASAGLSIGAALATEAGFTAFSVFLGSDMAKDWMADRIMPVIKGLGTAGSFSIDSLWNFFTGTDYYKKLEKDKTNVQNKKSLDTATTPQEKQAAQQAIDTTTATQNRSDDQDALLKQLK